MRIRSYKPEIFTHEGLWNAGPRALQLFLGLISIADREGRFRWRPRPIKATVLPYWDGDIEAALAALEDADLILKYHVETESEPLGMVCNFAKHQQPYHREQASTLPPPPVARKWKGHSPEKEGLQPGSGRAIAAQEQEQEQEQEHTQRTQGSPGVSQESNQTGPEPDDTAPSELAGFFRTSPIPPAGPTNKTKVAAMEVWEHFVAWRKAKGFNHQRAKPTPTQLQLIVYRLTNWTVDELKLAIQHMLNNAFNLGSKGATFTTLEHALKDDKTVQHHLDNPPRRTA